MATYDPDGYWAYIGWAAEDARQRREHSNSSHTPRWSGALPPSACGLKGVLAVAAAAGARLAAKWCGCRNRDVAVYTSTVGGKVNYVGITNNIERRAGEHIATKA